MIDFIKEVWEVISTLGKPDLNFVPFVEKYKWLTYIVLFTIIFCETGLIVTPFLPGDSLLFATGFICAVASAVISPFVIIPLLIVAALLGDNVNYFMGKFLSKKGEDGKLFGFITIRKDYLTKTNEFYEKHGGKTIIMARFVPIVRTFAPFVAGFGRMNYSKYISYCVFGAILWVTLPTTLGGFVCAMDWV